MHPLTEQFCHPDCHARSARLWQPDNDTHLLFADSHKPAKQISHRSPIRSSAQQSMELRQEPSPRRSTSIALYHGQSGGRQQAEPRLAFNESTRPIRQRHRGWIERVSYQNIAGGRANIPLQAAMPKGFPKRKENHAGQVFILCHLTLGLVFPTAQ